MTYNEWETKYQPIKNHLDDNASYGGIMFETFGKELEFVMKQPDRQIWTLSDYEGDWDCGDEDSPDYEPQPMVISAGYHLVNRMGYFITKLPLEEDLNHLEIIDRD